MDFTFQNTQQGCCINTDFLGEIIAAVLASEFSTFKGEACFHLVSEEKMASVNWDFLQHEGPTDVITFDLAEDPKKELFLAEIYICPGVAKEQAEEFETTWQDEMVRYHVHALLHLKGYDDLTEPERIIMKREEERIMQSLRETFDLQGLEAK